MATNKGNIYIDRHGGIIYFEFIATAIVGAVLAVNYFDLKWVYGIVVFIPLVLWICFAFFEIFLFRWLFSSAASVVWAYLVYLFAVQFGADNETSWVLCALAFCFMLWVHWDEYQFESNATINMFNYWK